ncbi:MAG: DUF4870 domain-containing protein [Armatimonadetes bacterium]|nr:DUF4870 domain-containing protein [Armatimonadota bacterium]
MEDNVETQAVATAATGTPTIKSEDKILSIVCHLAYFAVVGSVLVPLIVWLLKKDESPWLAANAKQAFVYQGVVTLAGIVLSVLMPMLAFLTFGLGPLLLIPVMLIVAVALMVPTVLASIANWNGEVYTYPAVGQLADKF